MKTDRNFTLTYILLVIAQILICNFINTGPYVFLSILPAAVLCLPLGIPTILLMIIAAVTGLAVDWLAEGIIGLNMLAIVPVALVRNAVIPLLFGKDCSERGERFSIHKNGLLKVSAAIFICQTIFLAIYIVADGAGTRPFLFNLVKFAVSLLCSCLLSIPVTDMLTSPEKK